MTNQLKICDLILRDAHQSLLATRMRTDDMLPIAAKIDQVGYWAVEMWGGATFDSAMRFLGENPWDRIRRLKALMPNTPFLMLLRGQNVVGYKHYPDDVLERFIVHAHADGIDVFRIFDALNDVRNMRKAMQVVKREGAHVQASICYTIGPPYDVDYFVATASQLADMGADSICIKDMAGLITPYIAYELVARLKADVGLPVHLHSHSTSGMATAALLKAIEAGVDIVDTAISALSGITSHPPTESIVATLAGTERDTGFDLNLLAEIAAYFVEVRKKYARFESGIKTADVRVLQYQMREELGYPPLVTPSSQIVGTQATLNVVLGERYKIIPEEVRQYVRGYYGRPPAPIDPEIQRLAIGDEQPIDCRPADLIPPGMENARAEIGDLARDEEDVISYALFPQVARPFLERRARGGDGKEPVVAAIAGLMLKRLEEHAAAAAAPSGLAISPWKVAWRPGAGRWMGLIDGAGGMR
jgi:pyruvate/oxaloacetate carboxyltransferase